MRNSGAASENVSEPVTMCGEMDAFRLEPGGELRAPSGLVLRFGGGSVDHYDDGHSETLLSITLTKNGSEEPWLQLRDYQRFGGFLATVFSLSASMAPSKARLRSRY